jgi:hypothetical protein
MLVTGLRQITGHSVKLGLPNSDISG